MKDQPELPTVYTDVFERPFDSEDDPRLRAARVLTRDEAEAVLEHRGDLIAALATQAHDIKGWRYVPVEPTEEMSRAYYEEKCKPGDSPMGGFSQWATWDQVKDLAPFMDEMRACHRAMLSAAPIPLEGELKQGLSSSLDPSSGAGSALEGEIVYLRDVGHIEESCWVPCAQGDPGAVMFAAVDL